MDEKVVKTKQKKYGVGSRITFQLTEDDEKNKIIEFINLQDNVSQAIREVLRLYVRNNEIENISSTSDTMPTQKELEAVVVETLLKVEVDIPLSELYVIVGRELQLSEEQLALRSTKSNDNIFQKKIRFVLLGLKNKGLLDTKTARGFVRIRQSLRKYSLQELLKLDSIIDLLS